MAIRAVVFDIGGVLQYNPRTGWVEKWETHLALLPGEFERRLGHVWHAGSIGTLTLSEVEQQIGEILGVDRGRVNAIMVDAWAEYVGTLNEELTTYLAGLRTRYLTAILSNSFVGAREREYELYRFADMCDLVIYSHEEGVMKPDRRIYELLVDRLNVMPQEIIFVDDVEANIVGARELGIEGVLFRDTAQAIADVEALLDKHVDID